MALLCNYRRIVGKTTLRPLRTCGFASQDTVGRYLGKRLAFYGATHFFTVPGDYTLSLLDEMLKVPSLSMISCCNELNAGYAADGMTRSTRRLGIVCVTYMVGGLSTINAIAGSYSGDLPIVCISGGPNTNDANEQHLVHHTIGEVDLYQQLRCFQPVVAKTFSVKCLSTATSTIDDAIHTAVSLRKPVYLEIPVNLAAQTVVAPDTSASSTASTPSSDSVTLNACLEHICRHITDANNIVLIVGSKVRKHNAEDEILHLSQALGCATVVMPDAKGVFPETHVNYVGRTWGCVSTPHVEELLESADLVILAGAVLNDYTTTGWTATIPKGKSLLIGDSTVQFGDVVYTNVQLIDVISQLKRRVQSKPSTLTAFQAKQATGEPLHQNHQQQACVPDKCQLSVRDMQHIIQDSLTANTTVLVETGDSWFIGQNLKLPAGCKFHMQMQYGSIGWSVGALLGLALAEGHERRVLALIGDGSFQVTAQELSTMIRYRVRATIVLLNNRGYTIETQIHDGPYNRIQGWKYSDLPRLFNGGVEDDYALGLKATTADEFESALRRSETHSGVCLIECNINTNDCTHELKRWGLKVAAANARL